GGSRNRLGRDSRGFLSGHRDRASIVNPADAMHGAGVEFKSTDILKLFTRGVIGPEVIPATSADQGRGLRTNRHERVIAVGGLEQILARAAVESVISVAADQSVVASAAEDRGVD